MLYGGNEKSSSPDVKDTTSEVNLYTYASDGTAK